MSLQDYTSLASAAFSGGMLLIWTIYAWLFFEEFRRRRAAFIFIHEAGGGELNSSCLLVNLSGEPVHVACSLAVCDGATVLLHNTSQSDGLSVTERAKQGPLQSGESLVLGSFEAISREIDAAIAPPSGQDSRLIEIRVAAIHGYREWPVGARRCFRVNVETGRVTPATAITDQLQSRRQSREVQRWIDACHDP